MSDLGYYDESYPPSVLNPTPPPVNPTGATGGTPGSFTPGGSTAPANITALRTLGALGNTTAWTVGQFIVLGDSSHAYWNGTLWAVGEVPAPPPEEPEE